VLPGEAQKIMEEEGFSSSMLTGVKNTVSNFLSSEKNKKLFKLFLCFCVLTAIDKRPALKSARTG